MPEYLLSILWTTQGFLTGLCERITTTCERWYEEFLDYEDEQRLIERQGRWEMERERAGQTILLLKIGPGCRKN